MEPVETKPYKKASKQIDRVILGKNESDLVAKWVETLNARAEGLIRFTKSEVVNFLIQSHPARLSLEKQQAVSVACYDETRWLGWAMGKMRAAKKSGGSVSFDELTRFRDELLGQTVAKQRRRKKDEDEVNEQEDGGVDKALDATAPKTNIEEGQQITET